MDKEMDMPLDPNCVQVKGMNGLSLPYIKRFFGHAGTVQEVRKLDDRVIVKFKHRSSLSKAHRLNGRIVDKNSIKIRDLHPDLAVEGTPHKKRCLNPSMLSQPTKEETAKFDDDKYHNKIKYGPLDVPYHWAQVMKILDIVVDSRARWIMHELFALELTQALHYNFFKLNSRSSYNFLTIKELFLGNDADKNNSQQGEHSIQKLEIFSNIPNDMQYEPNYECYANDLENRVRSRLRSFKQYGVGHRALHLYSILFRNALLLSEECLILSTSVQPTDKKEFKKIQLQINTKDHIQISVQQWPNFLERSEYRVVDEEHPSKEIQILSDDCFHENSSSMIIYDIFRDGFDGTIDNNCASDIFQSLSPYFSPNYLLVKHIEGRKILYIRLDFELRLLNATGERLEEADFDKLYSWGEEEGFEPIPSIVMSSHNLVLSSFSNQEKVLYLIKNYLTYFCEESNSQDSVDSFTPSCINVIAIVSNPTEENKTFLHELFKELYADEKVSTNRCKVFIIVIDNEEKFQQLKCRNFIQAYVDDLKAELTLDSAKLHARLLVERYPEKFKQISNANEFAEQTLWGVYLIKSKRKAKNRIMESMKAVRSK